MLKEPSGTNWEFEGFKVMTDMRLLITGGTPVPLTGKAFDTLVVLVSNIWRQPLTGRPRVQITNFSVGQIFSFAWSPNGRWLSLGIGANRSDVLMSSQR